MPEGSDGEKCVFVCGEAQTMEHSKLLLVWTVVIIFNFVFFEIRKSLQNKIC